MEISRRFFWTLLFMALTMTVNAQQEVMQQINDIKMKAAAEGYLTDQQMTDMPEDSAVVWCTAGILRQLGGGYTKEDIQPHLKRLVMQRGDKRLVFVYLKKGDLGAPSSEPSKPKAPTKVQAKFDIVDNKIVRKDEPSNANKANNAHESHEANKPHETNKPNKPHETNKPHEPKSVDRVARLTAEVMTLPDVKVVLNYLKDQKQKGCIANYGAFAKAVDIDHSYIILFTREEPNRPIGILSPVINGKRINLQTDKEDSIEAHSGCGALWVMME